MQPPPHVVNAISYSGKDEKLLSYGHFGWLKKNRKTSVDTRYLGQYLLCIFMLCACSPVNNLQKPPVIKTAVNHHHIGKFVWHDLLTNNIVEAKRFYGGLFGWRFRTEKDKAGNALIINRGKVIGNIRADIENTRGENNAIWLSSLSVPDIDEAVEIVRSHGGEVFADSAILSDRGRVAIVSDSQGAALMLLRASGGDPVDSKPLLGEWLWMELWTRDLAKAREFYQALVAYQIDKKLKDIDNDYQQFKTKGIVRAGMLQLPLNTVKPNWLPYVRVDNVRQAVTKAQQLGGRIIIEPDVQFEQGNIAVIADPTGGVLAIQELRNR